jgi:uracil-DNA glycosylase
LQSRTAIWARSSTIVARKRTGVITSTPHERARTIDALETKIVACECCPDLRAYCARIATEKKRAHRDQDYWGRPVPAFGDFAARVLLVGLAPGAHGSNRTGRMFTGDASGDWLRCAPPGNKPTPEQLRHCFSYLVREIELLDDLHVVVGLGAIGTRAAETALASAGYAFAARHAFVHGAESIARSGDRAIVLLSSYHPSRQNTNTGVLTEPMLDAIFTRARAIVSAL